MWTYNNQVIDSIEKFPEGSVGIIYKITRLDDGKFYIGKKSLYSERNIKLGKKELEVMIAEKRRGKLPSKKKIVKESDWLKYWSSNDDLKKSVKEIGQAGFKREILKICFSKKQLTWYEIEFQAKYEVLTTDNCWNDNILGKFFKKDLVDKE